MNGKRDVMVCVTGQRTCERLIREGAQIAGIKGVGVHARRPRGRALYEQRGK